MSDNEMYDKKTIAFSKEQEKIIKKLEFRAVDDDHNRGEGRNFCSIDYARVLYSSSFRRLQGKMQLLGINASHFYRNRLTHSLEVAQIARSIATNLKLKSPIVTETCSLCHDIGNPPFGHHGEVILNELSSKVGGYEGNAQTFRILRLLEKKHHAYEGLNLTYRTLFGVTKYFFKRSEYFDKNGKIKDKNKKIKFLYDDDYDFLKTALEDKKILIKKSIDAQVMDLADEIAYAAHDLEDAMSFSILSIGEMVHEFKISKDYNESYSIFTNIVQKVQEEALKSKRLKTSEEYFAVLKKELTSTIVNELCNDIHVVPCETGEMLGYKTKSNLAIGLKKLLFSAILRKPNIQHYEKKGEKVIRGLFEVYSDNSYNKDRILLPPELRNLNYHDTRLVVDYISGMMDSFAIQEYERYFGKDSSDAIYYKLNKESPTVEDKTAQVEQSLDAEQGPISI